MQPPMIIRILMLSACLMGWGCARQADSPISTRSAVAREERLAAGWLRQALDAHQRGDADGLRDATGHFAVHWKKAPSAGVPGFSVVVIRRGAGVWDPAYFDSFSDARDISTRRFTARHERAGIGAPLVGWRENRQRAPSEQLYPPEGIVRPVTAVLDFDPPNAGPRRARLIFLDTLQTERFGGTTVAADFTAPWAELTRRARRLESAGVPGLFRPDQTGREPGLFLMEPYDPAKTPLVLVHGLLSTPLAWRNTTNALFGDREIRRHYQVWHYYYPTAAPFLYSAKIFREQLDAARRKLDPSGRDPAMQRTVVVAHSMGGLLAKTLITDSQDAVLRSVLSKPLDRLHATADEKEFLSGILRWQPQGHVKRVIFIAVPHRGSRFAVNWMGRIGDLLTVVPRRFANLYARLDRQDPDALTPAFRGLARGRLTSIDTLSPEHPLLPILNEMPFSRSVRVHSIIGNRGRKEALSASSDGVVPYPSSHLAQAESELVVPTGHNAYAHPMAFAEIRRILLLP